MWRPGSRKRRGEAAGKTGEASEREEERGRHERADARASERLKRCAQRPA